MKERTNPLVLILLAVPAIILTLVGGCPVIRYIPITTMGTSEYATIPDSTVIYYDTTIDCEYDTLGNLIGCDTTITQKEKSYYPNTVDCNGPNNPFKFFNDQLGEAISEVPWISKIETKDNGTVDTTFYFHQLKKAGEGKIPININYIQYWRVSLGNPGYDPDGLYDTMWKYSPYTDDNGNSQVNYWAAFVFFTNCVWDGGPLLGVTASDYNTNIYGEPVSAISDGAMYESTNPNFSLDDIRVAVAHKLGHAFNFWHCTGPCMMNDPLTITFPTTFSKTCSYDHFHKLVDSTTYRP